LQKLSTVVETTTTHPVQFIVDIVIRKRILKMFKNQKKEYQNNKHRALCNDRSLERPNFDSLDVKVKRLWKIKNTKWQ
jgi:hypothetical protein